MTWSFIFLYIWKFSQGWGKNGAGAGGGGLWVETLPVTLAAGTCVGCAHAARADGRVPTDRLGWRALIYDVTALQAVQFVLHVVDVLTDLLHSPAVPHHLILVDLKGEGEARGREVRIR